MTKRRIVGLAVALALFEVATSLVGVLRGEPMLLFYSVVTWSFVATGTIAWLRRPDHPTGKLLLLTAFFMSLLNLVYIRTPLTWTFANLCRNLWLLSLGYLVLAFPGSRLRSAKNRILFGFGIFLSIVPQTLTLLFEEDQMSANSARLNLIHVDGYGWISDAGEVVGDVGGLLLLLAIGFEIRRRWRRTTKPARRAFTPVVVGGFGTICLYVGLDILLDQIAVLGQHREVIARSAALGLTAIPVGLLLGLLRAQARRAKVGDLVVELGELPVPDRLQDALRKTLGDPSLKVGLWVPEVKRYLTPEGPELKLPEEDAHQVATFLDRHGEPLAAIVHDRALLDDPGLVESVKAAARLTVENERLQDEVLAQLNEVHASRARIVEAADEERRRIERNLHDGAQQRLVSLSLSLRVLQAKIGRDADPEIQRSLDAVTRQLQEALAELRDLARGIHPAILSEGGLGAALESLAERAAVKVALTQDCGERLPESVEVAAYYVVAEALANIAKHANASVARVTAKLSDETLHIDVSDDGVGGVDLDAGSGLRGLADRVHALGGRLDVTSRPGSGTTVSAAISVRVKAVELEDFPHVATPPLVRRRLDPEPARETTQERPLLACRGVGFSYDGTRALSDVDLDVYPHEIVALLGTNGAGKSTLLRIVAGLAELDNGTIHFAGDDITYYPAETRSRWGIAYVPGGKGAFGSLSVAENLKLFANGRPRKEIADRVARAFETFPVLAARRSEVVARLSRGQQQMVALAKAFMTDPRLLIIDELCLGLAPEVADQLLETVVTINDHGVAVLFVEQSAERGLRIAERAYFLDAGKVVFMGPARELRDRGDLLRPIFLNAAAQELARA